MSGTAASGPLGRGTAFYKMTGSGNDFVVLDGREASSEGWSEARIRQLCDRRTGIGADGLVVLTPDPGGMVRMAYWNADGSRAAMCGNAALCGGRLAAELGLGAEGEVVLLTDAGPVRARGWPTDEAAEISLGEVEAPGEAPTVPQGGERWMALGRVGVPHLVVRVGDVEAVDVVGRGRALRHDRAFGSEGANVNFVSPGAAGPGAAGGGGWAIRTYERGVEDETLACGTGIVAAGLALARRGEATLPVALRSRGGPELRVSGRLDGALARGVWLGGQGRLVFRGQWAG